MIPVQLFKKMYALVLIAFILITPCSAQLLQPEQNINWSTQFALPGLDGGGWITAVAGNKVYLAKYTGVWPSPEPHGGWTGYALAVWDGEKWHLEGKTEFEYNTGIQALNFVGSEVYIGGDFKMIDQNIDYAARWNGTQFQPLGEGIDGRVRSLATDGSNIYAGGDFTKSAEQQLNYIGKFDGFNWQPLQEGSDGAIGTNGYVFDVALSSGGIVAGGAFSTAGGVNANYIAGYNNTTSSWYNYGSGMNNYVRSVALGLDGVYAGGDFTQANGFDKMRIARWSGEDWESVAGGSGSTVLNLEVTSGGQLYATGNFFSGTYNTPAKYMGTYWEPLGDSTLNIDVQSMASMNSDLYVGFQSQSMPGTYATGIAKWNGEKWRGLGNGVGTWWSQESTVRSFAKIGDDLYIFGTFQTAGADSIIALARWDGQKWNPLGSGFKNAQYASGYALKADGSNLYLGGTFNEVGDVSDTKNIAMWNGKSFEALATGVDDRVNAIEIMDDDLYAAGSFFFAGDSLLRSIGRWDGSTWHPLNYGLNSDVYALKAADNRLYVGGKMTGYYEANFSIVDLNYICYWDGNSWNDLGGGVSEGSSAGFNTKIESMDYLNGKLYVGGDFTMAGTVPANNIAMWDGENWHAMGAGLDGDVTAILANGTDVYAGGNFTTTAGDTVFSIAKWNGSSWEALGTGLRLNLWFVATARVDALFGDNNGLWIGGNFSHAGENFSHSIAYWSDFILSTVDKSPQIPRSVELKQNYPNPFNPQTVIEYYINSISHVKLEVFDNLGRKIKTLVNTNLNPGSYKVEFNGKNLSSGIYYYRLTTGKGSLTKKFILLK